MKGILLGLGYQLTVAVGLVWVAGIARGASPILKANIMLGLGGLFAFVILGATALFRSHEMSVFTRGDVLHLALGAILILVIGESLYISGLSSTNATSMAFTALGFPAICLALEVALGRVSPTSFGVREYLGVALLVVGFVLVVPRASVPVVP